MGPKHTWGLQLAWRNGIISLREWPNNTSLPAIGQGCGIIKPPKVGINESCLVGKPFARMEACIATTSNLPRGLWRRMNGGGGAGYGRRTLG